MDEEKPVPKKEHHHYVMPDIEPYKAMGGDAAGQMITSRSHHRDFIRRNGFIEVGNEHRAFFEHGGKSDDNPFKRRNDKYERVIDALNKGRSRRRS